jgi:hypothetical protein
VDLPRKRIGLSMRSNPELGGQHKGGGKSQGPAPPRSADKPPATDWFTAAMQRAKRGK